MGHKIFVSYKYADSNVKQISNNYYPHDTVRTYVDAIESYIEDSEHIYKGESDNEDLSELSDDAIWEKLKNRIYDSTLTIVMISPGMREVYKSDRDQWIPWEISYSLKAVTRKNISGNDVTSASNAVLAVVVPDRNGSYSYYINWCNTCGSSCRLLQTDRLFRILQKNMFNIKKPNSRVCETHKTIYSGESSYIPSVTWDEFVRDPESCIQRAYDIQSAIELYDVVKEMNA